MTSEAIAAVRRTPTDPTETLTKTVPNDIETSSGDAAQLNEFLGEAIKEYEAEFGAFTEEELSAARSEMGR